MTLIFFSPPDLRMTANSVCSSAAAAAAAAGPAGDGHRGGRRHAPLLLQQLGELGRLQNGQLREVVDDFCQISHDSTSFV